MLPGSGARRPRARLGVPPKKRKNAKAEHLRAEPALALTRENDVLRIEVAVHEAGIVCGRHRVEHLAPEAEHVE